jgi:hypothetical protein
LAIEAMDSKVIGHKYLTIAVGNRVIKTDSVVIFEYRDPCREKETASAINGRRVRSEFTNERPAGVGYHHAVISPVRQINVPLTVNGDTFGTREFKTRAG